MIVLEGPDMAGKTTLADELFVKIRDAKTRHPMVRHFTKVDQHFDKYWGYRQCVARDVIMDRFHLSHVVYRHAEDAHHLLTPYKYELVDAAISQVGGIVVALCPSAHEIEKRWEQNPRSEMYSLKHVLKVAEIFRELLQNRIITTTVGTFFPKIDLIFASSTPDMADTIIKLWTRRQLELEHIAHQKPSEIC